DTVVEVPAYDLSRARLALLPHAVPIKVESGRGATGRASTRDPDPRRPAGRTRRFVFRSFGLADQIHEQSPSCDRVMEAQLDRHIREGEADDVGEILEASGDEVFRLLRRG